MEVCKKKRQHYLTWKEEEASQPKNQIERAGNNEESNSNTYNNNKTE